MPYVAVVNAKGEDDLAVFSRYKIEDYRPVLEPGPSDNWPRPGIFASIEAGGARLDVYVYPLQGDGRRGLRKGEACPC